MVFPGWSSPSSLTPSRSTCDDGGGGATPLLKVWKGGALLGRLATCIAATLQRCRTANMVGYRRMPVKEGMSARKHQAVPGGGREATGQVYRGERRDFQQALPLRPPR